MAGLSHRRHRTRSLSLIKRVKGGKPVKPLWGIHRERKHPLLWADEHVETLDSIFNTWEDARACKQFSRLEGSLNRRHRRFHFRRPCGVRWEKSLQRSETLFIRGATQGRVGSFALGGSGLWPPERQPSFAAQPLLTRNASEKGVELRFPEQQRGPLATKREA